MLAPRPCHRRYQGATQIIRRAVHENKRTSVPSKAPGQKTRLKWRPRLPSPMMPPTRPSTPVSCAKIEIGAKQARGRWTHRHHHERTCLVADAEAAIADDAAEAA